MAKTNIEDLRYVNELSLGLQLKRALWAVVCVLLFRPTPSFCLHGWRSLLLRFFGASIGQGCKLSPSMKCWAPWNLELGNLVCIGEGVDCYSVSKIKLGDKVTISQRSFLCTASHDIRSLKRPLTHFPITVKDHVWVCAESFVGPGVEIGEGAVIAARAVVTKNVNPWEVVGGNPAALIKKREINS